MKLFTGKTDLAQVRKSLVTIISNKVRNELQRQVDEILESDAYKNFHDTLYEVDMDYADMYDAGQEIIATLAEVEPLVRKHSYVWGGFSEVKVAEVAERYMQTKRDKEFNLPKVHSYTLDELISAYVDVYGVSGASKAIDEIVQAVQSELV